MMARSLTVRLMVSSGRPCRVCAEGRATVVENGLKRGHSIRAMALALHISKDAIRRHLTHVRAEPELPERGTCRHCGRITHEVETCRWCRQDLCGACFVWVSHDEAPCIPWCEIMATGQGETVEEFMASSPFPWVARNGAELFRPTETRD
jgi:hypothetical protein